MPIFEYTCRMCGADFEKLVRGKDALIDCPTCGSEKVEKKFSIFGCKSGDRFVSSAPSNGGCSGCSKGSCAGCS